MPDPAENEITRLLGELESGEPRRAQELLPLVYEELRALARARMRHESPGQTLQATSLVHEAYLRVLGGGNADWNSRGHFFGAAAQAMRRILVEQARRKSRARHGGEMQRVELDDVELTVDVDGAVDVLAVEEALKRLEASDPRKGKIVDLRYFAGLTNEETAKVLDLSVGTIEREWRFIRSWLQVELAGDPPQCESSSESRGASSDASSRPSSNATPSSDT